MTSRPTLLQVAAVLVGLEALVLLGYAALELLHVSTGLGTLGITTSLFFLAYAVLLALCATGLLNRATWTRAPVVLTELIQLGLAWDLRGGVTAGVSVALSAVSILTLICVLAPSSLSALSEQDPDPEHGED